MAQAISANETIGKKAGQARSKMKQIEKLKAIDVDVGHGAHVAVRGDNGQGKMRRGVRAALLGRPAAEKKLRAAAAGWAHHPPDFETVGALGAMLRQFQGTVFLISHDRTFVNRVATQILQVKNGSVVRHPGSCSDCVCHLEKQVRREPAAN